MRGVRTLPNGKIQVHITFEKRFYSEEFPAGTLPATLLAWQVQKRADVRSGADVSFDRLAAVRDAVNETLKTKAGRDAMWKGAK